MSLHYRVKLEMLIAAAAAAAAAADDDDDDDDGCERVGSCGNC